MSPSEQSRKPDVTFVHQVGFGNGRPMPGRRGRPGLVRRMAEVAKPS
jgi:hypothetical protein